MRDPGTDQRKALGRAIAAARGSQPQDDLALAIGVHQTTISQWEKGITAPARWRIPRIEEALGIPPGELVAIYEGADPDSTQAPADDPDDPLALLTEARRALDRLERILRHEQERAR